MGKAQSIDTIISAAKIIDTKEKNIMFHIIGDGSELENSKKQAEGLQNIKFYGQKATSEMQQYYDMADVMLVTLSDEYFSSMTLPGKVQACMKTGNPIISAANGETEMIITEAGCGYAVGAEKEEELANAILEFHKLPQEKKEQMSQNSIDYYNQNFEKEIIINKLLKILNKQKKEIESYV